jgi:large subunit ribosomal protein L33
LKKRRLLPYLILWEEINSDLIVEVYQVRLNIQLECTECKRRNYSTSKNKKNTPERLEVKKYCKWDKKVTLHKETKK